ncbi:MAG: hypothetical protein DSY91_05050, partial [Deltaproteobacteria bacterium]
HMDLGRGTRIPTATPSRTPARRYSGGQQRIGNIKDISRRHPFFHPFLFIIHEKPYEKGATEFGSIINEAMAAGADVLMGGGHFQDGTALVQQAWQLGWKLKAVAIMVAPTLPEFKQQLGDAANGVMAPAQWEIGVKYSPEAAKKLGVEDRITWLGWLSRDKLLGTIKSSHLYLGASNHEGMSNILLEALAVGTPCVAKDTRESRELLGSDLLLFETPSELVEIIERYYHDEKYAEDIVERAKAARDSWTFDWDQKLLELFTKGLGYC